MLELKRRKRLTPDIVGTIVLLWHEWLLPMTGAVQIVNSHSSNLSSLGLSFAICILKEACRPWLVYLTKGQGVGIIRTSRICIEINYVTRHIQLLTAACKEPRRTSQSSMVPDQNLRGKAEIAEDR